MVPSAAGAAQEGLPHRKLARHRAAPLTKTAIRAAQAAGASNPIAEPEQSVSNPVSYALLSMKCFFSILPISWHGTARRTADRSRILRVAATVPECPRRDGGRFGLVAVLPER